MNLIAIMDLSKIPFGEPEKLNVLVEISQGTCNKYELDEASGLMTLDFVFRDGLTFPYNYGFVPNTLAPDNDPLDAIIYSSEPLHPGIIATVKPFGLLKMLDRGQQDNKLLTVPLVDPLAETLNDINDLADNHRQKIQNFLTAVGRQKNKSVKFEGFAGKQAALEEIKNVKRI